jgi:hypothetical protein
MTDLVVESLLRGPAQNATYADIANKMMQVETNSTWKRIIREHFEVRKVIGKSMVRAAKKPTKDRIQYGTCHCCMARKEHVDAVEQAIKEKNSKGWFGRNSSAK